MAKAAPPETPDLKIRPAQPDEAELLTKLAVRSKAVWGYDDAFMAQCRDELTVTRERIDTTPVFVLEAGGGVIGFYALGRHDDARADLDLFFVEPGDMRGGHGRALWGHMVAQAKAEGYRELIIDADPDAAGFYERMGARPAGSTPSVSIPGRRLPRLIYDLGGLD